MAARRIFSVIALFVLYGDSFFALARNEGSCLTDIAPFLALRFQINIYIYGKRLLFTDFYSRFINFFVLYGLLKSVRYHDITFPQICMAACSHVYFLKK